MMSETLPTQEREAARRTSPMPDAFPGPEDAPFTLIDQLLAEQQRLTAVERFARKHEAHAIPAQARYYRDLLPLETPRAGEQYAFAVDLDRCTGCKACVSACHSLNGLDDEETWRNTGLLHGDRHDEPYQQTVTTACHHCVDPACLNGCPVLAYEKDAHTGIVRHLDDQCIGCRYCVLKCPYDVPKFSAKRGIVRKCDMCHGRLAAGEAPACVQACPSGAIAIRVVSKAEVSQQTQPGDRLLPDAFDSSYTKPSTTYTTRRTLPSRARAGDAHTLRIEHAHWPLIWMLLLTQAAAGIFTAAAVTASVDFELFRSSTQIFSIAGFALFQIGLAASVLHLGRPLGAWRAFLGFRRSWMSREIVAFGMVAAAATAFAGASWWEMIAARVPLSGVIGMIVQPEQWVATAAWCAALLGLIGVFCSVMIYADTRRPFWNGRLTFPRFFSTALLLGAAGAASLFGWLNAVGMKTTDAAFFAALCAVIGCAAFFVWEMTGLWSALRSESAPNHRSARVIAELLRPLLIARGIVFAIAMILGLLTLGGGKTPLAGAPLATAFFLAIFVSQIIERYFFFTAVAAPRMPGGLA